MVQLKVNVVKAFPNVILNFNSAMVQLKEATPSGGGGTPAFQFRYGTIKSAAKLLHVAGKCLFQFRYGTIKRQKEIEAEAEKLISIPLWYN